MATTAIRMLKPTSIESITEWNSVILSSAHGCRTPYVVTPRSIVTSSFARRWPLATASWPPKAGGTIPTGSPTRKILREREARADLADREDHQSATHERHQD